MINDKIPMPRVTTETHKVKVKTTNDEISLDSRLFTFPSGVVQGNKPRTRAVGEVGAAGSLPPPLFF